MLDLDQVRAEADAHAARMKSELWADDDEQEDGWAAPAVEDPRHMVDKAPPEQAFAAPSPEILLRLDALGRNLADLTEAVARIRVLPSTPTAEVPVWLQDAAGNPQTYDAPDPARETVCVRVHPSTYARLQQVRDRLGLRTMAGAWECLLRLGLAAAERLPFQ